MDLRVPIRRFGLLGLFVYLWSGLPFTLYLLGVDWYIKDNPTLNGILAIWLFNTFLPYMPGAGFAAAAIGVVARHRLVAFLAGFLPNMLVGLLFTIALGSSTFPFWLLASGFGLGLMGVGGVFYGNWKREPARSGARILRLAVLLGLAGLAISIVVAYWASSQSNF